MRNLDAQGAPWGPIAILLYRILARGRRRDAIAAPRLGSRIQGVGHGVVYAAGPGIQLPSQAPLLFAKDSLFTLLLLLRPRLRLLVAPEYGKTPKRKSPSARTSIYGFGELRNWRGALWPIAEIVPGAPGRNNPAGAAAGGKLTDAPRASPPAIRAMGAANGGMCLAWRDFICLSGIRAPSRCRSRAKQGLFLVQIDGESGPTPGGSGGLISPPGL